MYKILLTSLSLAALSSISTAQITPSQTTEDGIQTTIDCFSFNVEDIDAPNGNPITSGENINLMGTLTGGTFLSNSPFQIQSTVAHFNNSGTTSASLSNGEVSFTGSVGLITLSEQIDAAARSINGDCKVLDFSFTQCTTVDERSGLFDEISVLEKGGSTVYYGEVGNTRESVSYTDAFVRDPLTGSFTYDSTRFVEPTDGATDGKDAVLAFYTVDERGIARELESNTDTVTILKDFTVCVECTQQVPEPSSTLLMGLGAAAFIIRRKR